MTPSPGPADLRLDLDRRSRLGMVEAIWGEHKSAGQIAAALEGLHQAGQVGMVTRVVAAKAEAVLMGLEARGHDPTTWRYHPDGRCLCSTSLPQADPERAAVAIVAGGSSDLGVASEANLALACHGIASELVLDVGVAGLHRLLGQLDRL